VAKLKTSKGSQSLVFSKRAPFAVHFIKEKEFRAFARRFGGTEKTLGGFYLVTDSEEKFGRCGARLIGASFIYAALQKLSGKFFSITHQNARQWVAAMKTGFEMFQETGARDIILDWRWPVAAAAKVNYKQSFLPRRQVREKLSRSPQVIGLQHFGGG